MHTEYYRDYSPTLDRDMEMKLYGHAGKPVLFIPCQDGRFFDFENFKMTDVLEPWIESGQVMVFSIDTLDLETWSDKNGDPGHRIWRHEQWMNYICYEVVPFMQAKAMEANGWSEAPRVISFGCSLGATHAANLFFRRPDLFEGTLALSGIYTAEYGFGDYMNELVYNNSPVHYLANFPEDHHYINLYNNSKGIICVGQGAWEQPDTTRRVKELCDAKGIKVWVDFWGYDVNHDWDWWYKQVPYFMPYLLGEKEF